MIIIWLLLYGLTFSALRGSIAAAGRAVYLCLLFVWLYRFRTEKYLRYKLNLPRRKNFECAAKCFAAFLPAVWNLAAAFLWKNFTVPGMTAAVTIVCAAIAEEIFFRGWMADKTRHMKYGILLVNIVFALAHGVNLNQSILLTLIQVLFAFFMGISFSLIVNLTDSLWPAVWIHCLVNLTAVCCTAQGAGAALVSLILAVLAAGYMLLLTDIEKIEGKKGENYETVH